MSARRLLLVHSSAGHYGADRQLELIATGLDPDRFAATALLPFDGPLARDLERAGIETLTGPVPVVRRELLSPAGALRLARQSVRLRRLLARRPFDVVHLNTSAILPWAVPRRLPLVVSAREIYAGWGPLWPPYRAATTARADRLLCVSEAVRRHFGAGVVLHDGLPAAWRKPPRDAARRALGLPPDAFVVAVLGRITGWKGQALLAHALAQPGLEDAVGIAAGDAWPGQEHRARGLERLRLIGFQADPGVVLGAADAIVVPSTRPDPLPNAALEAAAAGCCVVAAGHGGLPEIVRDGETGVLVTPNDPRALAEALRGLASDPERVARLGAAAARDVPARFTREGLLGALQAHYDAVLG